MPNTYYQNANDPLEGMYPQTYYQMMPAVRHRCDMMYMHNDAMYTPSREELDRMSDDVIGMLGNIGEGEMETRQFGGRRLGRDFISILLINELLGRRRHFFDHDHDHEHDDHHGHFGHGHIF